MTTNYVYEKYFLKETPNGMGTFHQLVLSRMFSDLDKPLDMHHDHSLECLSVFPKIETMTARIEGKMARAFEKSHHTIRSLDRRFDEDLETLLDARIEDTLSSRALLSIDGDHIHGTTRDGRVVSIANTALQQITVGKAELLLATMVFLDKMRFYLFPTRLISPTVGICKKGRNLVLAPQHGNNHEGILFLEKVVPYFVYETSLPIARLDKQKLLVVDLLKKALKVVKLAKAS